MSISDKIVVVTGAGSGLGRALAIGLVRRGAIVIGFGSRDAPLSETETLVNNKRFSWHVVDVSEAAAVKRVMLKIVGQFGKIDVLINSAAVYPKISFLEQDAESWIHAIAVNLGGVANCCREVLPVMMRQDSGRIINIGSFADLEPIPNSSAYAASKGGVHALTKAIVADLGGAYPDVICAELIPGAMSTQMNNFAGKDPSVCVEWVTNIINLPAGRSKSILFEGGHEVVPRISLTARLKQKIMFWRS